MKTTLRTVLNTVVVSAAGLSASTPQESVNGLRSMGYSLVPGDFCWTLQGMRVKLRVTIPSAESAAQESPGRRPQDGRSL